MITPSIAEYYSKIFNDRVKTNDHPTVNDLANIQAAVSLAEENLSSQQELADIYATSANKHLAFHNVTGDEQSFETALEQDHKATKILRDLAVTPS